MICPRPNRLLRRGRKWRIGQPRPLRVAKWLMKSNVTCSDGEQGACAARPSVLQRRAASFLGRFVPWLERWLTNEDELEEEVCTVKGRVSENWSRAATPPAC